MKCLIRGLQRKGDNPPSLSSLPGGGEGGNAGGDVVGPCRVSGCSGGRGQ